MSGPKSSRRGFVVSHGREDVSQASDEKRPDGALRVGFCENPLFMESTREVFTHSVWS